jgi:hypothetical protein
MLRAAGRILLTGLLVTTAGCGGGTGADQSTVTARPGGRAPTETTNLSRDLALARTAVLRLGDFPRGWAGTVTPMPRLRCDTRNPYSSATASSISQQFEQGDRDVQQIIWTFHDVHVARRAYASSGLRSTRACLRRIVVEQVKERRGGHVGPITLVEHVEESDHSRHARFEAEGSVPLQTPLGAMNTIAEVIADVEVSRVGRGVSLIVMLSAVQPLDEVIRDHVARLTDRRLARAVARPGA